MALVIVDAPIGGQLYAAYTSQTFIVTETVTTGQPPPALEVIVKSGGTAIETLYYEAIDIASSSGTDTCTFKLDIREVVQKLFQPRDLLPLYGAATGADADFGSPHIALINCEFVSWKPNGSGFLERDAGSSTSSIAHRVINAVRLEEEEPAMVDFYANTNRRFLTSKPLRTWTDLQTNEYLYVYNPDNLAFTWIVEFRQPSGFASLRSWGRVIPSNDDFRLLRLGVGGLNMLNMSWDEENIIGGGTDMGLENENIAYYEVYGAEAGTTDAITEKRRYYVKWEAHTCVTYRIHFLNRYGVWDYFPVMSEHNNVLKATDDPYERTMADDFVFGSPPITRPHVRMRGQVRADKGFEVEVAGFSRAAATWLQELVMSPLAFVEMPPADQVDAPTRFYPIVIKTRDFNLSERKFNFEVIFSKQKFSQRV